MDKVATAVLAFSRQGRFLDNSFVAQRNSLQKINDQCGGSFMHARGMFTAVAGLLSIAVIGIAGSGTATADPLADKSRETITDDGWHMRITKTDESLDRYPNLASTLFTREGFVSLKAVADITGSGNAPVNSGTVALGYQIGCQVDVSNGAAIGLAIGPSVTIGVTSGVGGSATITPTVYLKPGTITDIPFGTKPLTGRHGSITSDQVHIKIDGCMGPVSLRSYAQVRISTPTADNALSVYGDPIYL